MNISRSIYYYHINLKEKEPKEDYEKDVISAFKESNNNYGAKKIRNELRKRGIRISKRRIRRIMEKNGLVSNYTIAQFKVHKTEVNQDKIDNELNREFLIKLLNERFNKVDYIEAKRDVIPFIENIRDLDLWSSDFFIDITNNLKVK